MSKYGNVDNKSNLPAKSKCNKDKIKNVRKRGLQESIRTPRKVKNNSRSANKTNFATINAQNNPCNLSSISVNDRNSESETRSVNNANFATIDNQNNPCNISSVSENDSNSENEAVVENCTIFHSTSKEKVWLC